MADISKDELRKEITAILKDADLQSMTAKKVRQQLEEKLDCDLLPRKKEIDDLVMEYISSKDKKKKDESEDGEGSEEEEEEEEESEEEPKKKPAKRASAAKKPVKRARKGSSDDSDASEGSDAEGSDEDYSPKKSKGFKTRKLPPKKKKGGSDSDSDEDWKKSKTKSAAKKGGGKGKGSGYTKAYKLSPELSALVGAEEMARHEVVKKVWSIIKERNLYDPKNKQFAICDDDLMKVIGTKRFRTFGMMKYLKTHFID